MMYFRTVKKAIKDLLNDKSLGNFHVVGYQKQNKSSDEVLNSDRLVQVYFSDGAFPKSAGRMRGPKTHDLKISIDLTVSAKAQADLSALESTTASELQKSIALMGIKDAAEIADDKMDELIDRVYQILMDARNFNLGLEVGELSSRWIDRITKDTTIEYGDLIVKTSNLEYSCRVQEYVYGDEGYQPDPAEIVSEVPIGEEDEGTGVTIENSV